VAVSFEIQHAGFSVRNRNRIRKWITGIIKKEGKRAGQLSFLFSDDESVLDANRKFLDHDTFTDIITFDYCEGETVSGDIIISADRVRDNATKFGTGEEMELLRVIIHGVLHLCGYSDKSAKDIDLMRKKEDEALLYYSSLK
jgi:probable rRNA maturation factor